MSARVLMVICQFPPQVLGGAEKMAETFARSFLSRGLLRRVVTCAPQGAEPPPHPDLPVEVLPVPNIRMLGSAVYLCRLAACLVRHRREYDVIYLGLPKYEVVLCTLLRVLLRKALVVKFESATWERQDNPVFRIRGFAVYEWALRKASAVIVLSEGMKKALLERKLRPERIHIIPNAVDTERFRPATDPEAVKASLGYSGRNLVVYLGRLVKAKGIYELLDAFDTVVKQGQPAHLLMLGQGPEEDELRRRIHTRGLDRFVTIESCDNPASVLPAADLFVLPSYSEGVSCALLEAMAAGVCCVTTPVGGSVEVIRDGINGQFVPARNVNALADTLSELLDDPKARDRLARAARVSVLVRYDLETLSLEYSRLFDRLTRRSPMSEPVFSHPVHITKTEGIHP